MNGKGFAPLIGVLIIAVSVLIGSALIAYKPTINCSISKFNTPATPLPSEAQQAGIVSR